MNLRPDLQTNPYTTYASRSTLSPPSLVLPSRTIAYGPAVSNSPQRILLSQPYSPEYVLLPQRSSWSDPSFPVYYPQSPYTSSCPPPHSSHSPSRSQPYFYLQFSMTCPSQTYPWVAYGPDRSCAPSRISCKPTYNPPILPSLSRADGASMPPLMPDQIYSYQPTNSAAHSHASSAIERGSTCSRCKNQCRLEVARTSSNNRVPRKFKLCVRCRALQRERTRRWLDKRKKSR